MIYVRDKGRMCNNLLQYGHLYAWGREHGKRTLSMRFAYKYPYFAITHTREHNFWRYLMAKFAANWKLMPVVSFDEQDADYSANELVMLESANVVAQGWYARYYDLFLKYFDEIKELFKFDERIRSRAHMELMAGDIPGSCRLGLHVRRGDYATWKNGKYLFSDEQYIKIIKEFHRYIGKKVTVYLCTNDATLDAGKYQRAFDASEVRIIRERGNEAEDLAVLSECDMLIGPPSTYSLVASMYRDLPLYWVKNPDRPVDADVFGRFDTLFKEII